MFTDRVPGTPRSSSWPVDSPGDGQVPLSVSRVLTLDLKTRSAAGIYHAAWVNFPWAQGGVPQSSKHGAVLEDILGSWRVGVGERAASRDLSPHRTRSRPGEGLGSFGFSQMRVKLKWTHPLQSPPGSHPYHRHSPHPN